MFKYSWISLSCLLALGASAQEAATTKLWYNKPAPLRADSLPWAPEGKGEPTPKNIWESRTLPVGNGRMGGTIYGGTTLDCVTLNEVSLWSGGPNEKGNGSGYNYGPLAGQDAFGSFQPFANLFVETEGFQPADISGYKRTLVLDDAIHTTEWTANSGGTATTHRRECFASHPDDVIIYHAEVENGANLTANVALLPFHEVQYSCVDNDTICMRGTLRNGEQFEGRMQVRTKGGSFSLEGAKSKTLPVTYQGGGDNASPVYNASGVPYIRITNAQSFTLLISLATDYKLDYSTKWKGANPSTHNKNTLSRLAKKSLTKIRRAHTADFRSLYDRLSINLGTTPEATAALPTDERLRRYRNSQNDPGLEATIYQYGRYVLISGSRSSLPVNLQGIWNNKVHAPWASDYHNNINLQMCYWGAEVANLSECHMPLIRFIDAMQQPLAAMTRREFGNNTRGWTTRISQNPWGGGGWVKWNPPVNAWYALHVWDHYLFTGDKDYLRNTAYPILKNISHFWEDHLKELGEHGAGLISAGKPLNPKDHPELQSLPKGALVAPAGWSHEWGPVEDGCTHDQQLIQELFDITASAARILGVDAKLAASLEDKKNRLVGSRIAPGGYLQEWIVDRPNMVSGHRHTSHLIGVYPGSTISLARTPDLARAAMKSLQLRGLSGDNRRSWTWPWRTALWARFHEPEQAYEMVKSYLMYNTLDNLFGNHPPMQMDGTYGMTGGMSEMLLQSHAGRLELLPALPSAWQSGSVRGLRARGNISVDMAWEGGKITSLQLTTTTPNPQPVTVIKNGETLTITPKVLPPATQGSTPKKAKTGSRKRNPQS